MRDGCEHPGVAGEHRSSARICAFFRGAGKKGWRQGFSVLTVLTVLEQKKSSAWLYFQSADFMT